MPLDSIVASAGWSLDLDTSITATFFFRRSSSKCMIIRSKFIIRILSSIVTMRTAFFTWPNARSLSRYRWT
uniref:Uncharacterized protein n=1 Tax=Anguilla anguilla TaxID=7936 RepID=A0A0E9Q993_ANGAN